MNLMPTFLQPAFVVAVVGQPLQAKTATYGFIAERPDQISGDRPESKRTPFCVRLTSPDLLAAESDADVANNWEVDYNAFEMCTASITQAIEMDMPKVREAIQTSCWRPLLGASAAASAIGVAPAPAMAAGAAVGEETDAVDE